MVSCRMILAPGSSLSLLWGTKPFHACAKVFVSVGGIRARLPDIEPGSGTSNTCKVARNCRKDQPPPISYT